MKRILMIDDCMIQLQILSGLLKSDYEVETATSGLEGVSFAKRRRPDLILLDYDMPHFSGRETLEKLRADGKTRNIPVVFLTGVDEKKEIEAVLRLKPQGYLLKPVKKEKLFETIWKILGK